MLSVRDQNSPSPSWGELSLKKILIRSRDRQCFRLCVVGFAQTAVRQKSWGTLIRCRASGIKMLLFQKGIHSLPNGYSFFRALPLGLR